MSFLSLFRAPATSVIYTLSLHDALPISGAPTCRRRRCRRGGSFAANCRLGAPAESATTTCGLMHSRAPDLGAGGAQGRGHVRDRKSTRLNSSHSSISYAVFCLKKKKNLT